MPTPPAGFKAFTAQNIQDALGNKLNGTLQIQPTDGNDVPVDSTAGGAGGPISRAKATLTVTSGAIPNGSIILDTTLTNPLNICLRITIADASGIIQNVFRRVQTNGATFNLDTYTPVAVPGAMITAGPAGQGYRNRGTWAGSTAYAAYDNYQYGGNTYVVTSPYTSGASFGSTDTANASVMAAGGPAGQGYRNRGAWAATTTYAAYDNYQHGGNTYVVNTAYTSGSSFGSTDTTNASVMAAVGADGSISPLFAQGTNMFDATAVSGTLSMDSTGATNSAVTANYTVSAYIPVSAGVTYVIAKGGGSYDSRAQFNGATLCDVNKNVLSGFTVLSDATTFTPSQNGFVRFSTRLEVAGSQMLSVGSTPPANYVPYNPGAALAVFETSLKTLLASLPNGHNFFNSQTTTPMLYVSATGQVLSAISTFYLSDYIPVLAGVTYTIGKGCGFYDNAPTTRRYALYDYNRNFLSGAPLLSDNTTFTPSVSGWLRFVGVPIIVYGQSVTRGTQLKVGVMGDSISSPGDFNAAWEAVVTGRTGATLAYLNARGGRTLGQAFESYQGVTGAWSSSTTYAFNAVVTNGGHSWVSLGGSNLNNTPAIGSAFWKPIIQSGSPSATLTNTPYSYPSNQDYALWASGAAVSNGTTYVGPDFALYRNITGVNTSTAPASDTTNWVAATLTASTVIGGTPGNTFAQDIAGLDVMIVFMGTNGSNTAVGASGDAATVVSNAGYFENLIEVILTAKPTIRLLIVTPYYTYYGGYAAIAPILVSKAQTMALPVLNLMQTSGINPITVNALTRDLTHPTDFCFGTRVGAAIAEFVRLNT